MDWFRTLQAGQFFNFTLPEDTIKDPENETITYSFTVDNGGSSWLSFDPTTREFTGTPVVNTDAKTYSVIVGGSDVQSKLRKYFNIL